MPSRIIADNYSGLLFEVGEMIKEIEFMRGLARKFIEINSYEGVIREWKQSLEGLRNAASNTVITWEIPRSRPLRTNQSTGDYQPDGQGQFTVYGELSAIWKIEYIGKIIDSETRAIYKDCFLLNGNASTRTRIVDVNAEGGVTLAEWTFDVGSGDSPGCHFHSQVEGAVGDKHFPRGFDVPRFPTYLVTPMDALDFLLGELFQKKWLEHVAKNGSSWSPIQRRRLKKSLEWHFKVVDATTGTWSTLKDSKPARLVLLG